MGIGSPFTETFARGRTKIKNSGMVAVLAPLITLRQELTGSGALQDRGGFSDSVRQHFVKHLENCDKMRRHWTYNPSGVDIKVLIDNAKDPNKKIEDGGDTKNSGEEIVTQSGGWFDVPWALDGTDPNIPSLSALKMRSNIGTLLLQAVDRSVENLLRSESALNDRFLHVTDSLRCFNDYSQIYSFLMTFGGDENRVDIVNPPPSEEPLGVNDSENRSAGAAAAVR